MPNLRAPRLPKGRPVVPPACSIIAVTATSNAPEAAVPSFFTRTFNLNRSLRLADSGESKPTIVRYARPRGRAGTSGEAAPLLEAGRSAPLIGLFSSRFGRHPAQTRAART